MKTIQVNGINYNVNITETGDGFDYVELFDINDSLVAIADINRNIEQISVRFYEDEDVRTETADFFVFEGKYDELATWMAGCL